MNSVAKYKQGRVYPYHVYIPSFGEWGFVMLSKHPFRWNDLKMDKKSRFLSTKNLVTLGNFSKDIDHIETEINTIDSHKIVNYYENDWSEWYY